MAFASRLDESVSTRGKVDTALIVPVFWPATEANGGIETVCALSGCTKIGCGHETFGN